MNLPFLKPIRSCSRCENYIAPDLPYCSEGTCNIHECAMTDEWGESKETSSYPEVSEVWQEFGEDHSAKYCGEFELRVHAFTPPLNLT